MASVALDYESLPDLELARRIAQRDALAVRVVTRRNNQRLYRTAWSVLKDRADAEEAVQEEYLKAFGAIDSFQGASSLSTWLTRIVLNEALGRRRSAQRKIRVLREQFGISDPVIPACDAPCHAVLRGWFAIWFANLTLLLNSYLTAPPPR